MVEIDNIEYNTKLISVNNFFLEESNNININKFRFYYINKKDIDKYDINKYNNLYNNLYFGQLGLSPKYDDNYLNLLYILKEQKIIDQMSFGFSFGKNKENNYLFLGSIDPNKNDIFKGKDSSNIISLDKKLIKKYNRWGTKIDALVVEKKNEIVKHTKYKYFVYFNPIEDRIFVPDKIMEYLITRIFNIYIKNNICFITEYSEKKFINCKKNKIIEDKESFPTVIFVIKKYGFKLTFKDLFIESKKENELIFIIQKNYYDIDTSIIMFGNRFFKNYLIEFDLEKYNIIFHSDNILPTINLEQIDDDFWRDIIRDYNKETEHYDSNYEDDKEENDNNKNEDNEDKKRENLDDNKNGEYYDIDVKNKKDENKKTVEFEYVFLQKLLWIIFFVTLFFAGICIFFHFRKRKRIEKEKKYFNQPLNNDDNNREE